MVEINNQRKRRSSICWRGRRGTDNGRQKINHGYDVIVGKRLFYWLLRSPRKLVTLNPKLKSTGADATSFFPVGGMPTASSLAWKLSPKSQDATLALQQIKERGAAYDWSWWYPSGNRPLQQYLSFCRALVMVSSSIRLTAWLQNSKKRAEQSEIDVWSGSHRDYLRSGYLHHRLPVMGC